MNKTQISKRDMFEVLRTLINSLAPGTTDNMPLFAVWYALFGDLVNEISILSAKQGLDRKGSAETKAARRELLTLLCYILCTKMKSYANAINDKNLYNRVNYQRSLLERIVNAKFIDAIKIIIDQAAELQPLLVSYGVLPATITEADDLFTDYKTTSPLPKTNIDQRKEATTGIKAKFNAAMELLKKMDEAIQTQILDNPNLVTQYFNARTLNEQPSTTLAARGKIVDQDGNPLAFVTITCEALGIYKRATALGNFIFQTAENGIYDIIYARTGYETVTQSTEFYFGIRTEILVVMHRHI